MDDDATRDGSLLARLFLAACAALGLWRCSRCAALAAERAYGNARSDGIPHSAAAEAAFKVLTNEQRPKLPDVVAETQSTPEAIVDVPRRGVGPAWPAPQGLP